MSSTDKHEGKCFDFDDWDVSYTNYDTGVALDCPDCSASDRSAVESSVEHSGVAIYTAGSAEPTSVVPGEKFIALSELKPLIDAYRKVVEGGETDDITLDWSVEMARVYNKFGRNKEHGGS